MCGVVHTYSLPSLSPLLLNFTLLIYSYILVLLTLVFLNLFLFPPFKEMENNKWEGKRNMEEDDDEEDEDVVEDTKRKRVLTRSGRKVSTAEGSRQPSCQVEECTADMVNAKTYHRRHKVCEFHAKAPEVLIDGLRQRFCQQCSRFHQLAEFDDAKKSCRRRLAGHNERRRKSAQDYPGEGSS